MQREAMADLFEFIAANVNDQRGNWTSDSRFEVRLVTTQLLRIKNFYTCF